MIFKNKTEPYQKYIERGYFEIKEGISNNKYSDGSNALYRTTKVTPKGRVYILNKLVND
jgi:phage antirepressor YoqD-like protein